MFTFQKFRAALLRSKHAVEVSEKLALWIGLFGLPHILQCDNGTEFKDTVLLLLKKYGINVLNGRPRHPQTQGLVENHNSTLKRKLQAWIQDSSGFRHWAQALPEIALSMNHQIHSTTGESPYRVVFKQQMRMRRLSFTDRVAAVLEDENDSGGEECELEDIGEQFNGTNSIPIFIECIFNDDLNLTDDNAIDIALQSSKPEFDSECYITGTSTGYESARSQDSNHGAEDFELDDEIRTMFTNVRQMWR